MDYFDCHADTLTEIALPGETLRNNAQDLDLVRVEGFAERYTQIFAVWRNSKRMDERSPESEFAQIYKRAVDLLRAEQDHIVWCTGADEMELAHAQGKAAAFLSIEDVSIMGSMVEQIRELGFRFAMLSWNYENKYACGASENQKRGLTEKGRSLVKLLLKQQIVPDISHLSDRGVYDLFELTDEPVIASHSNVRGICKHPRNLPNDLISELIGRKGLIGINFYRDFVGGEQNLEMLIRHMDAVLELGGENVLTLGGDFDGCSGLFPDGIQGVQSIPDLYDAMLRAGFGEKLTEKICFENAHQFILEYVK